MSCCQQSIPRKLHFIWLGEKEQPQNFRLYLEQWKHLYPDYEINLWDDERVIQENIIPDNLKELYENGSQSVVFQSDVLRYLILQKHGGYYWDTDFEPLRPIPDSFRQFEFLGGIQNNGEVAIGFIGSKPNSKIINNALSYLPINAAKWLDRYGDVVCYNGFLPELSGPGFFNKIAGRFKHSPKTFFFTSDYLYPYWWEEKEEKRLINHHAEYPLAYAVHHWESSWKSDIEDTFEVDQLFEINE